MDEANKPKDQPSDETQSQFLTRENHVPPADTPADSEDASGFILSRDTISEPTPVASDTSSTFVTNEPPANTSQTSGVNWSGIRFTSVFTDIEPLSQQGAMSLVQKARLDGRWVVVKRLLPEHRTNAAYAELFFKEYFNGRDLQHEHIVNIYGRSEDQDGPFFYMEYVDGQPLSHRIPDGGIRDERLIRKIASELLDALSYAHKKQVYHRDLKPDNVLITNRGDNVKIIDFGLAAADTYDDIKNATFIGTKKYAAPEQTFHPAIVDGRADLYAFGVILLEMFTGSTATESIALVKQSFWREIIQRCTKQDPAQRFHNSDEILNLIEANTSQLLRPSGASLSATTETDLLKKQEELQRKERELQQREQKVKQQQKPPVAQVYTPANQPQTPKRKRSYGWVWWFMGLGALAGTSYAAQQQEDRFLKVVLSLVAFGIIIVLFIGVIRWWQRLNIGWKVLLLGILGVGGYYYYQQQQKEKDAVVSRLTNAGTLQSRVTAYYQAMEKHDFSAMKSYYAPRIEKYFDQKNLTMADLEPLLIRYWERTPEDHHEIDWNTFTHELSDEDDYVTVTFFMNYRFRRHNAVNYKAVRAKTVMKLDKELNVFYVAGG